MAEGGSSDLVKDDPDSFIISGVIDGVKQSFIDSGVDTEILAQLERLWVSKLKANTSGGLSITDVLGAPEPVKKTRSGGEGSSAPEMELSPNEEMGEKEKPSGVIVISSDSEELLSMPGTSVSIQLFKKSHFQFAFLIVEVKVETQEEEEGGGIGYPASGWPCRF